MVAFQYALPSGIPGAANRLGSGSTIEGQIIMASNPPLAFGTAVMMDASGQIRPPIAGDGATPTFYGMYVRPYPTYSTQDALGVNNPPPSGIGNVMKRGYMTVKLMAGTAVKGAPVHIGLPGVAGPDVAGGVTATAVSSTVALLANSYFMGPADASGMTEIAVNI